MRRVNDFFLRVSEFLNERLRVSAFLREHYEFVSHRFDDMNYVPLKKVGVGIKKWSWKILFKQNF